MNVKTRVKPYHSGPDCWSNILSKPLCIPMNQRAYEWEDKEISQVLEDIFYIFEETNYCEKMGSVIILKYDGFSHVYDGQQRILTIILILFSLTKMDARVNIRNKSILTIVEEMGFILTKEQEENKKKYGSEVVPKITCVNPFDTKALHKIFNNNVISYIDFVKNIDTLEEDEFECSACGEFSTIGKNHFIDHLRTQHGYHDPPTDSKLYMAYLFIYESIKKKNYSNDKILELNNFILQDMDVQIYESTDTWYVSRIFDWENNRGKSVAKLDIIKNQILVKVPNELKMEIYDDWEKLKKLPGPKLKSTSSVNSPIYSDYGQRLFDISIQLFNGRIERKPDYEKLFYNKIIKPSEDKVKPVNIIKSLREFFDIVNKLDYFMEEINKDKYGQLLLVKSRMSLNWELYKWYYFPIFWKSNLFDKNLVEMITKWHFRLYSCNIKSKSFSTLEYSKKIIDISNKILNNEKIDYFVEMKNILKNNPKDSEKQVHDTNIAEIEFSACENVRILLCFLEISRGKDINFLETTLEHIIAKKHLNKNHLKNNLGNLTLLTKEDNSACSSKEFERKKKVYRSSDFSITNEIIERFPDNFCAETILERSKILEKDLKAYTNY